MRNYFPKFTFIIAAVLLSITTYAAQIDTLMIHSERMDRDIEVLVIVPQGTEKDRNLPVLYLLHGYSGNAKTWINIKPELKDMAERDKIIIVCPNGENSWYWDSPKNPKSQFETFISKELINYIDNNYKTIKDRKGRAICGLSMGGHGALWISIRNSDIFGAAGSTSGGVDIRPFPENWEMKKQLGEQITNKELWNDHTVMTQLDKIKNGNLAIIIDCGTDDFFFDVNNKLHEELLKRKISHDYIVRSGAHNRSYWNNSIEYQWLFFNNFFNNKIH